MTADSFESRVLIADRDAALRKSLYTHLLDADVFSDCVSNGVDALAKLRETRYGLILLDLGLPGVDGVQVLQAMQELVGARPPIVLALTDSPESARALDVEMVQIILRRPVNAEQIAELVRSCIRSTDPKRPGADAARRPGDGRSPDGRVTR